MEGTHVARWIILAAFAVLLLAPMGVTLGVLSACGVGAGVAAGSLSYGLLAAWFIHDMPEPKP